MTQSAVVSTTAEDGQVAGQLLGKQILEQLGGRSPDVLILFISPKYNASALLSSVKEACSPKVMMGCSSAGEFTNHSQGVGQASAVAIRSDEMRFACGIGRGIKSNRSEVARSIVASFKGLDQQTSGYSSALDFNRCAGWSCGRVD